MFFHGADGRNPLCQRILTEFCVVAVLFRRANQNRNAPRFGFGVGDFPVDGSQFHVVFRHGLFLRFALPAERFRNLPVTVHFLQGGAVLVEIGGFGVVENRNADLHILFLGFQIADIGKRLRNRRREVGFLFAERQLRGVQLVLLRSEVGNAVFQFADLLRVRRARSGFRRNGLLSSRQRPLRCRNQIPRVRDIVLRNRAPPLQLMAAVGLLADAFEQFLALLAA